MADRKKRLNLLARRVLGELKKKNTAVDIILLPGSDLARLKARFGLKKPGAIPDVLAFPDPLRFPHPELRGKRLLGEVYLNRELDFERLGSLLIHGVLHLLGFSHAGKNDILRMEGMERKLMEKVFKKSSF